MNKKKIILFVLLIIYSHTLITFSYGKVIKPSFFKYIKLINPASNIKNTEFVKLELDHEIYSLSKNKQKDIRIFDNNSTEVPYYFYSKDNANTDNIINASIVNKTIRQGINTISVYNSSQSTFNKIDLSFKHKNFLYKVDILGSENNIDFVEIASSSNIFNKTGTIDLSNTEILFDDVSYKYIQINISSIIGTLDTYSVKKISFFYSTSIQQNIVQHPSKIKQHVKDKSVILIDNIYKNTPINKLHFIIQNPDFMNNLNIAFSNNLKDWTPLNNVDTSIYSSKIFKKHISKLSINFPPHYGQYIKIQIDDPKENIDYTNIQVYRNLDWILFEYNPSKIYTLYLDNPSVNKPYYEEKSLFKGLVLKTLPKLTLDTAIENKNFNPSDHPEEKSLPLWVEILIVLGFLLVIILIGKKLLKNFS